jgi:hypothetical protein
VTSINIMRAVENIRSGTNVYTPIVELIVNAIQAIRAVKPTGGTVRVTVLRSGQSDMHSRLSAVDGFVVRDDGIGFNEAHRTSFDTLYTDIKASDGGKGFGRFTCLKYFQKFKVGSVFQDISGLQRREFVMGTGKDIIINENLADAPGEAIGSVVTVSGLKDVNFPDKGVDIIARVLVEKLLPYFIDASSLCPAITISDESDDAPILLNDYLSKENRQIIELSVPSPELILSSHEGDESFRVHVFKVYAPRTNKSKISLVAHLREVTDVSIQTYVPEFADEFYDKAGGDGATQDKNYVIKAYVFGDYLDKNVSLERGGFNFQKDSDLIFGISQAQIEAAAATMAQKAIGPEISARKLRKQERINEYIDTKAPWHRMISKDVDFSSLPMNPSTQEIEIHLQKEKFALELRTRLDVEQILASDSLDNIKEKVAEVVENISNTSKNDLIHYVSMRRYVLNIFEKSLELDNKGKYRSEAEVHDIIAPRRIDSDEIDFESHNLWILDERLNFTGYFSSDKPLDRKKGARTDLTIFGKRVAFRGDNEASNPITIFEFKKPQRDDFVNQSSSEDPVQQIVRYVNDIRDGKYKAPRGRDMLVSENTPFYGYVVCDLTQKVKSWLEREKDFTVMPDGLGYFRWYGNIKLYVEVLSWTKVQRDAEMRNKIFFHKLGI